MTLHPVADQLAALLPESRLMQGAVPCLAPSARLPSQNQKPPLARRSASKESFSFACAQCGTTLFSSLPKKLTPVQCDHCEHIFIAQVGRARALLIPPTSPCPLCPLSSDSTSLCTETQC